jgi:hypothetical protein
MITVTRLALAPACAVLFAAMSGAPAFADTTALAPDAVNALAMANCQLDTANPVTLAQMNPVLTGEVDVSVVPGEITAHILRAQVTTSQGDVQQCTFGVLHRDSLLPRVQYHGTASLALDDSASGTSYGVTTEIELGNMGRRAPVDPTTEVNLGGFLTPVANTTSDPTFTVSVTRKSFDVVVPSNPTGSQGHKGHHGHHGAEARVRGHHHGHHTRPIKQNFTVAGTVPLSAPAA